MNDERGGIDSLRRAIDELAERLPAALPRRRVPGASRVVVAVLVVAAAAIAAYRFSPRLAPAPAVPVTPAVLGVEVKLLRVRGREVSPRVFDAKRAGTVVVAPAIGDWAVPRPLGAVVIPEAIRTGATAGALIVLGLLETGAAAIGGQETRDPTDAPHFAYHLRVVRIAGTSDYRGAALGCGRICGRPILVPSEEVWGTPAQIDGLAHALGGARADAVTGFIVLPGADGTAQFEATVYPGEAIVGLSFSARTPATPGAPHDMHLTVTPANRGEPLAEARILSSSERTVAIAAPSPVAGEWLVLAVTTLDPVAAEARVASGAQPEAIEGPVTPPVLIDKVLPRYTPQARKEGRQGTVMIGVVIDVEGNVRAPMVLRVDSGLEELTASAVEAVMKWRYRPAMRDGDPLVVHFTIMVEFRLT